MVFVQNLVALLAATTLVLGHPGQPRSELFKELRERKEFISQLEKPNTAHCIAKIKKRDGGTVAQRRAQLLKRLRQEKGLDEERLTKRQFMQEGLNMAQIMEAGQMLQAGGPPPAPMASLLGYGERILVLLLLLRERPYTT